MPAASASSTAPFDVLVLLAAADEWGAVQLVLAALPTPLPVAVLLVQPGGGRPAGASGTDLPLHDVASGTLLQPGLVYVAPPQATLDVRPGGQCEVTPSPGAPPTCPLDRLLGSLAVAYGERALLAMLSAPGPDGLRGARALRGAGGTVLVQAPLVPAGLAQALLAARAADLVQAPSALATATAQVLRGEWPPERLTAPPEAAQALVESMDEGFCTIQVLFDEAGEPTDYRVLSMNPAFVAQTGLEGAQGRSVRELVPGLEPFWFQMYGEIARSGQPRRFEHQVAALTPPREYEVYAFRIGEPREHRVAVLFRDVSLRKAAERDLKRSNQLLQTVFDSSLEYMQLFQAVRSAQGEITDFEWRLTNRLWNEQWGEMAGKRLLTENPAVVETGLFETFKRVTETGVPDTHEHHYAHEQFDGWFHQTAAGAEDGFLLSTLDVTERRRAEEAARTQQTRQAFVLQLSDKLRPLADPVQIQREACRLLGEALGVERVFYASVHNDGDTSEVHAEYANGGLPSVVGWSSLQALAPGLVPDWQAGRTTRTNDIHTGDVNRGSLFTSAPRAALNVPLVKDGRLVALLGLHQRAARTWTDEDVALAEETAERTWQAAERARTQAALVESESRLRALIEHLPGGAVFVVDHDLRYQLAQGEALAAAGFTPEDLVGRTVAQVMPPEQVPEYEGLYRRALAGEGFEYEHNAHGRSFITRGVPLRRAGGEVTSVLAMSYDITDRKRAEQEVQALNATLETQVAERTRRLADLNAELGNVIIRTAHNLEAPARRLGQLLDPGVLPAPQAFEGLPPYDPALLQDEVTRLKGVAQDLRQLSRLETRQFTQELLPLGELFAEVRAQAAQASGRDLTWFLEPLPIVRGDRALLRQALDVLMNFTLSPTRGTRYVTVSRRTLEGEERVLVEDDGLGLSGEEAATLFDLAVRTDQSVPILEGSGLLQVRRILARHGGWAWAEARSSGGLVVLAFPQDTAVGELEALLGGEPLES
ncbi:PAS domain-containing protein [Deinococcus aquaedulcis]|uniref:PAS domain-containing protein n=1 Tax=Deinococcus aquaedulcis TaxID=2840455 RepID=UPI001C838956|nr:PAS domain-containing protein [Deinococcus aquaedulcis]